MGQNGRIEKKLVVGSGVEEDFLLEVSVFMSV